MYNLSLIVTTMLGVSVAAHFVGCAPPVRRVVADESTQKLSDEQTSDELKATGIESAAKKIKALQKSAENGKYKSPANTANTNKKPLLSWRVHLLPFLEEQALYGQFHLDEPWDSDHNKQLIDKMPVIYRSPTKDLPRGKTTFLALVSKHSAVSNNSRGIRFKDIRDGASKTILFVEAKPQCAVTWTKPQDIDFDANKPMRCLNTKDGFTAVFCDGSVHRIPGDVDPETLRRLVDRRDGKSIEEATAPTEFKR